MDKKEDAPRGLKHRKESFSEWFTEVVERAELADLRYNVKGFLVHRPWSVIAMKGMYRLYEAELERRGHRPVWFPAVIPRENFEIESEHVKGFTPEVFWVTHAGDEELAEKLALRPTSETAMYKMYSLWIRSWRDLPLKLYQSCQVWRHETKSTRPFIRGREFYWIEAHDVFATREEAEAQAREDMQTTENVMHKEFGIPYMAFERPEWDKFAGAVRTYAADTLMPDGRAVQQPSTHLLGQNFAKPFGIRFRDKDEEEKIPWQTCYGPAIWRMVASIVAVHGDDKGLVFPYKIAPVQAVIVPIFKKENEEEVVGKALRIVKELRDSGIRAQADLSDSTPGWKFNEWELKGVPIRLEIGMREVGNGEVTLARRDTNEKKRIKDKDIIESVKNEGDAMTKHLIEKADKWFRSSIREARHVHELDVKEGGFVKVDFCSIDRAGLACAENIKEKYHLHVRGRRADAEEKPAGNCIVCGKKAGVVVYLARQY
ncbi:MAG: proline--tRNA ligase [Candidatus Aenigmarchaeota archaeon]|nr:proline--tRNA ligase [Candidatus Aenigmarchaeota archaeon]